MTSGIIGGLIGILLGIAGGIIGSYYAIKNTNGQKERKFMIKLTVVMTVFVTTLLVIVLSVGYPASVWVMAPFFGLVLPLVIYYGNKKQRHIREEESGQQ